MTEIILRESVENLGEAGDVVDVKPGFARNYLIPHGKALRASEGNLERLRQERERDERAEERVRDRAAALGRELDGRSLTFKMRAAEEGKLFGSVSVQDIVDRLEEEGLEVDRRTVQLDQPIKELGVYNVAVDLHPDVKPEMKVWVVAEE